MLLSMPWAYTADAAVDIVALGSGVRFLWFPLSKKERRDARTWHMGPRRNEVIKLAQM